MRRLEKRSGMGRESSPRVPVGGAPRAGSARLARAPGGWPTPVAADGAVPSGAWPSPHPREPKWVGAPNPPAGATARCWQAGKRAEMAQPTVEARAEVPAQLAVAPARMGQAGPRRTGAEDQAYPAVPVCRVCPRRPALPGEGGRRPHRLAARRSRYPRAVPPERPALAPPPGTASPHPLPGPQPPQTPAPRRQPGSQTPGPAAPSGPRGPQTPVDGPPCRPPMAAPPMSSHAQRCGCWSIAHRQRPTAERRPSRIQRTTEPIASRIASQNVTMAP